MGVTLFWLAVIVSVALILFKKKILSYIEDKINIRIPVASWYFAVFLLFIFSVIKISKINQNKRPSSIPMPSNVVERKTNRYYIIDGDTIAELISIEGTMSNIRTHKKYEAWDEPLVRTAVNKLISDNEGMTHYLYLTKSTDESFYASYYNGRLSIKISAEEAKANLLDEINSPVSGSGISFVNIFFAKLDKFKSNLSSSNIDNDIKKEVVKFQTRNFPKARKEYFNHVKNALWEKDIEVKMSGKNITYIGYMFVSNKVKKDTYLEVLPDLEKLRFKRVTFKSHENSEYTYWDIDSKNDNEL